MLSRTRQSLLEILHQSFTLLPEGFVISETEMIISRIIPVLRTGITTKKIVLINGEREARLAVQSVRWSGDTKYLYRETVKVKDKLYTILATTFWWWTLWYLIMDYDEFLGPVLPDPTKWTDEELGIPPV